MLLLILLATPSFACDAIQADNNRITKQLARQQAYLQQLKSSQESMTTACRKKETEISQRGAKAATAESCVTFRENAAMNKSLTETSETCAISIDKVRSQMERLETHFIAPQGTALNATVRLDGSLPSLAKECGSEMSRTRDLREQTVAIYQESLAAVTKAKEAVTNFTALGAQTRQFLALSEGDRVRCGNAEDSSVAAAKPVRGVSHERAPASVPAGTSPRQQSTITGNVKKDELPK